MAGIRGWWVVAAVLAIMALPGLAGSATAVSYAWTLTCQVDGYADATAVWDWLQDGQVIAGASGSSHCSGNGRGDRPAGANGISASITACAAPSACHTRSVVKTFDASGPFSLTIKAHASDWGRAFPPCDPFIRCPRIHSSISATFTITS